MGKKYRIVRKFSECPGLELSCPRVFSFLLGRRQRSCVEYLPSSYLGLLLGAPFKCEVVCELIVEKFHKRLGGWK